MNKVWEVIEREARDDYKRRGYRGNMKDYSSGMREYSDEMEHSYRMGMREDKVREAYECGLEDGYMKAMEKILHIIKDAD